MPQIKIEAGYERAIEIQVKRDKDERYFPHTGMQTTVDRIEFTVYGETADLLKALHKAVLEAAKEHGIALDEPVAQEVG